MGHPALLRSVGYGPDNHRLALVSGSFGTSYGPTPAVYQGRLFMAWKGYGNDTSLWWATTSDNLDRNAWSGQSSIPGVGSTAPPAAVVY